VPFKVSSSCRVWTSQSLMASRRAAIDCRASPEMESKLVFDEAKTRSEAVHVNLLSYVPTAPQKFGYVYHWLGDKGGLDLKAYEGNSFEVIDPSTAKTALREN
jgi:hypothetical protein